MNWMDPNQCKLSSGRMLHVPGGVLGLHHGSTVIVAGLMAEAVVKPGDPKPTPEEALEIALYMVRKWQTVADMAKAELAKPIPNVTPMLAQRIVAAADLVRSSKRDVLLLLSSAHEADAESLYNMVKAYANQIVLTCTGKSRVAMEPIGETICRLSPPITPGAYLVYAVVDESIGPVVKTVLADGFRPRHVVLDPLVEADAKSFKNKPWFKAIKAVTEQAGDDADQSDQ